MKINSIFYCLEQSCRNILKNGWYSVASFITMAACIFLLCISYAVVANVSNMVTEAENSIGVTVFFEEGLSEEEIQAIGELLAAREEVASITYISAEEAWEIMKAEYFSDSPELAAGFEEDNPLANSASYEIFLYEIEDQEEYAAFAAALAGVRKVNYSAVTASGLSAANRVVTAVASFLILLLLLVTVFLISNTIALSIQLRREEIRIMRMIGATSLFVRAPFVLEGLVIGCLGAELPLIATHMIYVQAESVFAEKLAVYSSLFTLLPAWTIFQTLTPVAMLMGVGIGVLGSELAVRKNLHV